MAAEAEAVREPDADVHAVARNVGHVVEIASGSRSNWLMVGGTMPRQSASAVIASSVEPAAPSMWPVIDLVDEIGTW